MALIFSLVKLPIQGPLIFTSVSNAAVAARIAPIERRWLLKEKEYIMYELLMVLIAVLLPIGKLNLVLGALYIVALFLQSTKGNELLPAKFPRSARRRTRNVVCALISAYFAIRLADSIQYLLIAAMFAGIAYFTVGSLQHIKRQFWGLVGWIEEKTEMSLPAGAKQNPMLTRKG